MKHRAEPRVKEVLFEGVERARPAPGVIEAIRASSAVVICPSNPLISIGPILAINGVRAALRSATARVISVSPVVGGKTLKGPTDRMLRDLGMEVSALQVAKLYKDFLDVLVIDHADETIRSEVEQTGVQVVVAQTIMRGAEEKVKLAQAVVSIFQ